MGHKPREKITKSFGIQFVYSEQNAASSADEKRVEETEKAFRSSL